MKIAKGHYVPKELITSEAVHEAVVKCFVAAGFKDCRPSYGNFKRMESFAGLSVDKQGEISWGDKGSSAQEPLTLQQLFTAENGLQWPDWAEIVIGGDRFVYFKGDGHMQTISGDFKSPPFGGNVLAIRQPKEACHIVEVNEMVFNARPSCWPPVAGMTVELWFGGQYVENVEFLCERGGNVIFWRYSNDSVDSAAMPTAELKPIRTEREKFIDDAWGKLRGDTPHKETTELIGQLYDLGYRLPVEK